VQEIVTIKQKIFCITYVRLFSSSVQIWFSNMTVQFAMHFKKIHNIKNTQLHSNLQIYSKSNKTIQQIIS